jgi:hypothetical protein
VKTITATIHIDAPPATVWRVLTDLPAYPQWNPLFPEATGQIAEGARLTLRTVQAGRRTMTVKPKILTVRPESELRWSAGIPGLIGGEHAFTLSPAPTGTELVQSETFRGILVPLSGKTLAAAQTSYETLNKALKARIESR